MMRNRSASRMRSIMSSLTRRSVSVLRARSRASAAIARERARSSGTSGLAADDLAAISDIATSLARDPEKWDATLRYLSLPRPCDGIGLRQSASEKSPFQLGVFDRAISILCLPSIRGTTIACGQVAAKRYLIQPPGKDAHGALSGRKECCNETYPVCVAGQRS